MHGSDESKRIRHIFLQARPNVSTLLASPPGKRDLREGLLVG